MSEARKWVEKKITWGTILNLIGMIALAIWMVAFMAKDVESNKGKVRENSHSIQKLRLDVRDTYVRKDVMEQILIRMDELNERQKKILDRINDR